jgi:hypothetical protein
MLMRSTGLGKTELVAVIKDVKPQSDHLIMYVDTTEPVKWKIRCTLTLKDAKKLIAVSMKFSIIAFVCSISRWFREPEHPGDF